MISNFKTILSIWMVGMTLIFSACGFKGDLYVPGKNEKKENTVIDSILTP